MKNTIKCPYCNKKQEAFLDHINQFEQKGEFSQECNECFKEFYVTFSLSFKTEKK